MKILILDDEESLVKILTKILKQEGHEVFPAYTAAEGIEKHKYLQPDLILLDLRLPDQTGMEVLEQLNRAYNASSVVILTGAGSVDSAIQAMKLGAEDYLEKPIEPEKLKLVIRRIAEKRGLLTQIEALKNSHLELYRKDYLFLSNPEMSKTLRFHRAGRETGPINSPDPGGNGHGQRTRCPFDPYPFCPRLETLHGDPLRGSSRNDLRIGTFRV